jgi:hypothetical protein
MFFGKVGVHGGPYDSLYLSTCKMNNDEKRHLMAAILKIKMAA